MLTWEEDVEATALRKRGWSISAIARDLGPDRKTVRDSLTDKREVGKRRSSGPDLLHASSPISAAAH
jgi:transposase